MKSSLVTFTKEYRFFFIVYFIFIAVGGVFLSFNSKEEAFFAINGLYSNWADTLFKWLTYLGDGLLFAILILALVFYRYRFAVTGLIIFLVSSLMAQLLKHFVFEGAMRPIGYFSEAVQSKIHYVVGVTRHAYHSFPSGHSTTAFALALFLVWVFNLKKATGSIVALLAILVGYSRVYLAVHFPIDVYVGSILGVITSILVIVYLHPFFERKWQNKNALNR